ncbi:TonB-dependent receptor [Brevundimonas aveniformis]|uniref:TonB-dependent receptor n=1 Tax=Brevundimonas aveniformis TaxID=370977 RepID=UPI000414F9CE|nr:TonB-dependent receptor [Brevundimonas aveniformis]
MLQVPPPPDATLPEIVVTAARLPLAAGERAFSVVRLSEADLADGRRLDEALGQIPAVTLFRRNSSTSANPTTQGIGLRGIAPSGAGRALVTLDGVPMNDPFGGWVIWSQAPTESLGGVDLIRGSGAGPYGAGALTGVVQLRERDAGSVLDASLAERGGVRLAGSTGVQRGAAGVVLSGLWERNDGFRAVRGPDAGTADTSLNVEAAAAAIRADLAVGTARLSLRAGTFEESRGSGLTGANARASGNVLSATLAMTPAPERPGWRVQLWRRASDLQNSSVAVAPDRNSTTPANDQFATPAVGWGTNLALRRSDVTLGAGRLEWEIGADARRAEGETREQFRFMAGTFTRGRVAGGATSVAGVYGEAAWEVGDWLVAGGARLDHWANASGHRLERDLATGAATLHERDPDRSGEITSARLAVRRVLADGHSLRAAAYSGFRPATLNELHRPFRVGNDLTEANAALEPERLQGVEIGWAWAGTRADLSATVFATRLEDAVVNVTIGAGPGVFPRAGFVPAGGVLRQRRNAGVISAEGLEATGQVDLSAALSLRGAVSLTDARMDGGDQAPQLTGLRPAQAPVWSATAGLDWTPADTLRLSADLRWEGRRFGDDLNSQVLDAAVTADLRADWRLRPGVSLYIALLNAFDAEVETAETATGVASLGPPRMGVIGLRVSY